MCFRIGLAVISVHRVTHHVVYNVTGREGFSPWRIRVVIADNVNTDPQVLETWIVQRAQVVVTIGARDEHVGRVIVRNRRFDAVVSRGHAHDQVASPRVHGAPQERAPFRVPHELHGCAEIVREALGDRVFETLASLVGERQVVRVGADPERRLRTGPRLLRPRRHTTDDKGQRDSSQDPAAASRPCATPRPTTPGRGLAPTRDWRRPARCPHGH